MTTKRTKHIVYSVLALYIAGMAAVGIVALVHHAQKQDRIQAAKDAKLAAYRKAHPIPTCHGQRIAHYQGVAGCLNRKGQSLVFSPLDTRKLTGTVTFLPDVHGHYDYPGLK